MERVYNMKKKPGYALLITIVITLVMSITALTMLTIVYRYTSIINQRKVALQEIVNPSEVEG